MVFIRRAILFLVLAGLVLAACGQQPGDEMPPENGDQVPPTDGESNVPPMNDGSQEVIQGSTVTVEYEGTFENGTVFDSSEIQGQPIQFQVGAGQIIPGFEEAIMGMEPGESKSFTLEPEEAYGERDEGLVQAVPRDAFEEEPQVGQQVQVQGADGQPMTATVAEVGDEEVTLDLNHPLAGETLNFDVTIVEVS